MSTTESADIFAGSYDTVEGTVYNLGGGGDWETISAAPEGETEKLW